MIKITKGIIYRHSWGEYPVWKKGLHIIRDKTYKKLTIRFNYNYTEKQFETIEIDIFKKAKIKNIVDDEDSYEPDYYEPKRKSDYL